MSETPPGGKGPVAWMAGHSVGANLIMLILLVGGYLSMRKIKQEVFPSFNIDMVEVSVVYPGASPEEVERGIVTAIENSVAGIEGIVEVTSTAREGAGLVLLEISVENDPVTVAQDIKSAVDRIITFPEEAEKPKVKVVSRQRPVLGLALYGDVSTHVLHELGEDIRDELIGHKGISIVEVEGIPPIEISIEINEENLRRFGLSLPEVATKIRSLSREVPAGGIKTSRGEILIRVKERKDFGKAFGEMPILTGKNGNPILLKEIATIHDSFEETDRFSRHNGKPAVVLEVFREGDQTPLTVAAAVREVMEKIRPRLPQGIKASITRDHSKVYRERMDLLMKNGIMGLVLVLVLLGLFLEPRLAFWVAMGIPVSFMGSFIILPFFGFSINIITMFAFIVALGIVVDDAIVVGEQVFTYRQEGMKWLDAAVNGAKDVAMPVVFSILTNVVTFLPIYFVPGRMGKIWKMLPVVVTVVFVVSLLESIFILPAHLGHRKEGKGIWILNVLAAWQAKFSVWFKVFISKIYGRFLLATLHYRYVVMAFAVAMLMMSLAYSFSGRLGFHLFPVIESDFSEAIIVLPYGTPASRTEEITQRVLKAAQEVYKESGHPELVLNFALDIGKEGSHTGRVRVNMAPPTVRNKILTTDQFTKKWRARVGEIPGVEYLRFASDSGGPGGRGRPVTIELSHRDMEVLRKASSELADALITYPMLNDIDDGFEQGKVQYDITLKPEAAVYGFTARSIGDQLRGAFYGSEVLRQVRGRNELKVMVRMPHVDRYNLATFEKLMVKNPQGAYIPLSAVVNISVGRSYTSILRRNGRRVVQVSADANPRSRAGEVLDDLKAMVLPKLLQKYDGLQYSVEGHRADIR
ncbi:efflux RND transporter permease subunit, partial [Myxococcota bacterium]|nr:efflux RND transporter permease subunit [Myxococcota bacterium]MBU1536595.1 efflux RND transporter permease subunit [Myxococcota bacterium]